MPNLLSLKQYLPCEIRPIQHSHLLSYIATLPVSQSPQTSLLQCNSARLPESNKEYDSLACLNSNCGNTCSETHWYNTPLAKIYHDFWEMQSCWLGSLYCSTCLKCKGLMCIVCLKVRGELCRLRRVILSSTTCVFIQGCMLIGLKHACTHTTSLITPKLLLAYFSPNLHGQSTLF